MSVNSLGISVNRRDSVRMWVSRSEESACLVIDTENTQCEIQMARAAVEALNDHLPTVLAGLNRFAAEDAAYAAAKVAGRQAVEASARARQLAEAAEAAGAPDMAASLRAAAAEATTKATAADAALDAFDEAAAEVDHVARRMDYLMSQAHTQLRPASS